MAEAIHQIQYGSKQIYFSLLYANRKTLGIKVYPDSSVQVVSPQDAALPLIKEKVKSKANWIIKQQLKFCTFKPSTPPRKYINGETHLYLGRQYLLEILNCEANNKDEYVKIYRGKMMVYTNNPKAENVEKIINIFYKNQAISIYKTIFDTCIILHKQFLKRSPTFAIRTLQKRWGSCSKSGKIILNTELIKASKGCIEYVIIHELCHLVHHNHNKEFYRLQASLCKDWEKLKIRLEIMLA